MSTQEFKRQNQQAIDMANRHHQEPPQLRTDKIASGTKRETEARKAREALLLTLRVFGCLLAAVLFLAAEFDPIWKTALCFMGFIAFVSMAAILIDRYCRGYCNGR